MLLESSDRIMESLRDSDVVLDIGGWAHPFNRANYVMDAEPYETRGFYNRTFAKNHPFPPIGGTRENFTKETWIQRDICDHTPFPFADKSVDMVICSHTLEDIRDPLWVCHEMIRIGKRGYIEIPSRVWETCRGHEPGRIAGLSHHRWLIEIDQDRSSVRFLPKLHAIHNTRYSLPKSVLRGLSEREQVTWLDWEDGFEYREITLYGLQEQYAELARFVKEVRPYSAARVFTWDFKEAVSNFAGRAFRYANRVVFSSAQAARSSASR